MSLQWIVTNWVWLMPALTALFFYGIGQGLVKKYIAEVPPARFCLYFVVAKIIINLGYFFMVVKLGLFADPAHPNPAPFAPENHHLLWIGIIAYIFDGLGWILYFQSIIAGPVTIVGTLSAAYPAPTVILAAIFLKEVLAPMQYGGVILVMLGCIGLSYSPANSQNKSTGKSWIFFATLALMLWGVAQTLSKYYYSFDNSSEANLTLFNTIGGALTLGVYGMIYGRGGTHSLGEWSRSFIPMGMMALGDLGVIIANHLGPISIITPLTASYPLVTLAFAAYVLKERISKLQWLAIVLVLLGMFLTTQAPVAPPACEKLYAWKSLAYQFDTPQRQAQFEAAGYHKSCLLAGIKADSQGNLYLTVPRWQPNVPATLNKLVLDDKKQPLLSPYPSWLMNQEGNAMALQSVLGLEIDRLDRIWILDQGHVAGKRAVPGSAKLVIWSIPDNKAVQTYVFSDSEAHPDHSFLNDLVVDTERGFAYITDSGIFVGPQDPCYGGLLVYDFQQNKARRVLHRHSTTIEEAGFVFKVANEVALPAGPMKVGADGIALSADRETLYWCPITGRKLYSVPTRLLRDFTATEQNIAAAVQVLGEKPSTSDGMIGDEKGVIYTTALEQNGVIARLPSGEYQTVSQNAEMIWPDGFGFDHAGNLYLVTNRLPKFISGTMSWNEENFRIWKIAVKSRSYLFGGK